jgi:hypothetical protein
MDGWMFCADVFLCEGYQVVTLGRIEGNFGITVQSEAFCNEHILAQKFEHIKIWHLMSQNYRSLLISCILYDLILLNFMVHAILEIMCLLNYVELCPLNL